MPPKVARPALNAKAEIPQILAALDQGNLMTRFFRKGRRPERRVLCLKTDTFEILQFPTARGKLTLSEETSTPHSSARYCPWGVPVRARYRVRVRLAS